MNRQALEYKARKYGLAVLLGIALLVFLTPLLLRIVHSAPITPGAQSYSFLRNADLLAQGIIGTDPLHETRLAPNPYSMLVAFMQLFGVPWLLPFLLMLLFLVLMHSYLGRLFSAHLLIFLVLVVVIISPSTSILATHHTAVLLALI